MSNEVASSSTIAGGDLSALVVERFAGVIRCSQVYHLLISPSTEVREKMFLIAILTIGGLILTQTLRITRLSRWLYWLRDMSTLPDSSLVLRRYYRPVHYGPGCRSRRNPFCRLSFDSVAETMQHLLLSCLLCPRGGSDSAKIA